MIKLVVILLSMLLTAPVAFAADSAAEIFVPGKFLSVAGAPDGSAYLLGDNKQVVRVKPDGNLDTIKLPDLFEAKATDRFCDLVADEKSLAFCGYAFPVIFVLDLAKPDRYEIVRPSDQEAASLHLLNVSRDSSGWRVRDTDNNVFSFVNANALRKLPDYAAIEAGKDGKAVVIQPPQPADTGARPGQVLGEDGRLLWSAPQPTAPRQVMSIDYLGFDKDKRDVFCVITASGELDSEFTLYAVKDGNVAASQKIPGPAQLEMQRFYRLAPDGSVLLVKAGENGVMLSRVTLK